MLQGSSPNGIQGVEKRDGLTREPRTFLPSVPLDSSLCDSTIHIQGKAPPLS